MNDHHDMLPAAPFDRFAAWYDQIYAARGKRYDVEAAAVLSAAEHARQRAGVPGQLQHVMDVACGTGLHLAAFHAADSRLSCFGIDTNEAMLAIARARNPNAVLSAADMRRPIAETCPTWPAVDLVTCLFASIAYLPSADDIGAAISEMATALTPGGVLIVEPGLDPNTMAPPERQIDRVTVPGDDGTTRTLTRVTTAEQRHAKLVIRFDFQLESPGDEGDVSDERWHEVHEILLAPRQSYVDAFAHAGLQVHASSEGDSDSGSRFIVGISGDESS